MEQRILKHAAVSIPAEKCPSSAHCITPPSPITPPLPIGCVREHKAITVDPLRVLGVELHVLVEEDVRDRGHAHGRAWRVLAEALLDIAISISRTRMAAVGLVGGINLLSSVPRLSSSSLPAGNSKSTYSQHPDGVDSLLVNFSVSHCDSLV